MNINDIIQDAKKAPKHIQLFYEKAFDIVDRIQSILEKQGKTQKDLARALKKSESEVSKWLTGQHNLTLRTIASIEVALGESVIITPGQSASGKSESDEFEPIGGSAFLEVGSGSMVVGPAGSVLSKRVKKFETQKIVMRKSQRSPQQSLGKLEFPMA